MKNQLFPKLLALLLLVTVAMSWQVKQAPTTEAAFGISPPWIRNLHALPGTDFEQIIVLSTNNPAEDMKVSTKISGDRNLINWVSIENQDNLLLEKGKTQVPMKVKISVPKRAGIKEYKGNIEIRLTPVNATKASGVSIALGANAVIDLGIVGTPFVDFNVSSITIQPFQENQPLRLELNVENRGNTEVTKIKTEAEIWNEIETKKLQTATGENLVTPVDPYSTEKTIVEIPLPKIDPGKYWIKAKAYKDDKVIFETKLYLEAKAPIQAAGLMPAIPGAATAPQAAQTSETVNPANGTETTTVQPTAVAPAAPVAPAAEALHPAAPASSNLFMILAFTALGVAVLAIMGMMGFMIVFLKKQTTNANTTTTTVTPNTNTNPNQNTTTTTTTNTNTSPNQNTNTNPNQNTNK